MLTPALALPLLMGCPFIFGPPELQREPDPIDGAADSWNDTNGADRPANPDVPTGDTELPSTAPEVALTAHLVGTGVELRFTVTDAEDDTTGGSLVWWQGSDEPSSPVYLDTLGFDGATGVVEVPLSSLKTRMVR